MTTPEGSTPMNKPVAPSSADVAARLAAIVGERYVLTASRTWRRISSSGAGSTRDAPGPS